MKFAKTLQMTADTLPDEYKGQVLNYKKFKKSINKIVNNLESTGVYEIPENEKCKVIYSLSNKDSDEGEIKSSLILYIDKDYVAELSQKDALELNSEEITIDPKLKEVIELSDDTPVEQEKVTKERIIRSFQISDSNSQNEYIFNKQLPLKRLTRRTNSDDDKDVVLEGTCTGRRNTLFSAKTNKDNGAPLKRSKSDGDKFYKIAKEKSILKEESDDSIDSNKENSDSKVKINETAVKNLPVFEEPIDQEAKIEEIPLISSLNDNIESNVNANVNSNNDSVNINNSNNNINDSNIATINTNINDNNITSINTNININDSNITTINTNVNDTNITTINANSNNGSDIKDNIPGLEKSDDIITTNNDENNDNIDNIIDQQDQEQPIDIDDDEIDDYIDCTKEENNHLSDEAAAVNTMKSLKVLLEADAQFLNELAASLSQLSAFQDEYKKVFETKINLMANILSEVSSPNMKDTYRWREILGIYCDSNIWKYRGKDRSPDEVLEQLKIFEGKIDGISRKFKTKKSQNLLKEFIKLNYDIVAIKRFYELNQTAIYKILKKHDKRTHLLASEGFPKFARDETFFKDNIVRSLVFQISSRLLRVIPNPEEYFCPICREISYKPIRLDCGHLYCLRCLIKAKKQDIRDCPLCRTPDVVYYANSSHVDTQLMHKLKHDFPREVKAKMLESKTEKAKEDSEALLHKYGYGNPNQCSIM